MGDVGLDTGLGWDFSIVPTISAGSLGLSQLTSSASVYTVITGSLAGQVSLGLATAGGSISGRLEQGLGATLTSGSIDWSAPGSLSRYRSGILRYAVGLCSLDVARQIRSAAMIAVIGFK